ncbi:KGK domain-containing protein [Aphanothece sacrum]|uniref:KGK family protein n=1 Tax=Aphanothece sacrum FPU1 TaxID=1920663 RepID=A0A401IBL3_APHSA|nr:KGK domain-containing protein [Aphanothece sacrum]GBF78668.1 hypothetical protein AsFPU1_0057 [Aphanothece sacrum FPU1]GBF84957.1 hypothetical protein AsFPU3_2012 [Aphanothece sacrum FPU3]
MSNNEYFETNQYLDNDDDVIAFSLNSMYKTSRFKQEFKSFLLTHLCRQLLEFFEKNGIKDTYPEKKNDWLQEGKSCEILNVGSNGWKKGKIRLKITLEFIPDEPEINQMESPLDDIRQTMNQSN